MNVKKLGMWRHRPQRLKVGVLTRAGEMTSPRPASRFTQKDLRRIKREGPQLEDLKVWHSVEIYDKQNRPIKQDLRFVPYEVLGPNGVTIVKEPDWAAMQQMDFLQFFQGLRQRNWSSSFYNPKAERWHIQLISDSGRFMRPTFPGYRAVVTRPDESRFWVNIPNSGIATFLEDYTSAGTKGAIYNPKRQPNKISHPHQLGYNHVFEQVFQAFEPVVPAAARQHMAEKGFIPLSKYSYSCPGEKHLEVSFAATPPEFSLGGLTERAPMVLAYTAAIAFVPAVVATGLFLLKKSMPTDIQQAQEFAQSKAKARKDGITGVTFKDVAGLESLRQDLQEIVDFLKEPGKYGRLQAKSPKGVLLEGPPGTGKTLIAKAIAGEAGVRFYQMSGSEFVEAIVGVGAARVRDLFKRARVQKEPCILFVDEIDALGVQRAAAGVKTNEEREQTLNQLLTEMDGFDQSSGVVFVAATNRADLLDKALTRAGRFDRKIMVKRPDTQARYDILKVHARKFPGLREGQLDGVLWQLARDTPNLVGADMANILNEAALEVVRGGGDQVEARHIEAALDRILQGVPRPPLTLPEKPDAVDMRFCIAVHEVGRALVATRLHELHGRLEDVSRVSVLPRGRDWSRTVFKRGQDEQYMITTKGRLLDRIRVVLAGRVAERLVLGERGVTTYGVKDLPAAFHLAERLVAHYGLSEEGLLTYAAAPSVVRKSANKFSVHVDTIDQDLFGSSIQGKMFQPSDATVHKTYQAALSLISEAVADVEAILSELRPALDAAVKEILSREQGQLTGQELNEILAQHTARAPTPV